MKTELLVIGYGNELRGDDGVGPVAARAVSAWNLAGVRALDVHQLTPELADDVGHAERVVFVDAGLDDNQVKVEALCAKAGAPAGHVGDPRELLALAQVLHGRQPGAWLVTIPAENVGLGEGLSPGCAARVTEALGYIRALARGERGGVSPLFLPHTGERPEQGAHAPRSPDGGSALYSFSSFSPTSGRTIRT
jgi:hydrogenase maturation protease